MPRAAAHASQAGERTCRDAEKDPTGAIPGIRCMVVARREVWWADLDEPRESGPGFRRPILIVQADAFNRSRLRTIIGVALSSNTRLLDAPGNVLLPAMRTGLPRDSVANVSQILILDKDYLVDRPGQISRKLMARVAAGVRLVLDL